MVVVCSILGDRRRASSSPADLTPKQPFVELSARVRFLGKWQILPERPKQGRTAAIQGKAVVIGWHSQL